MAPKWYEYAKSKLDKDEVIEKNYEGRLDGEFGYLFLTSERILFLKQEGFFRKNYEVIMDSPKGEVESLEKTEGNRIEIVDKDGNKHLFESDIGVSIIQNTLQEAIMAD